MTAQMEQIVRPFVAPGPFTARTLPPPQSTADPIPPDVVKVWGKGLDGTYTPWSYAGISSLVVKWTEKSRETTKVRVTNPDDDSQFVDVERINKLLLQSTDGQQIDFKLNWPNT